jgi:predicted phage-related endonuclease
MSEKQRLYTTPSSLGSYFGVGFNNPQEQFDIDLGVVVPEFDDDAQARMLLGKELEDSVLNYFEKAMGISITNRNSEMMTFYDEKIKGIMDGLTIINDEKTVVECKVSNSKSYKFTDNMGYIIQCQAYMLATGAKQALLCGLYQGEPTYKLIKRDEQIIKDIKDMTDFVVDALMGMTDFSKYPIQILSRYSTTKILPEITSISDEEKKELKKLASYKEQVKRLEEDIKKIENSLKENYNEGVFDSDEFKLTISINERKGGMDIDRLSIEHPEIDYSKYLKPNTTYKMLRFTNKKKK